MITITENAAKYINNYLTKRGKGLGVRLGVKTSGCSGMAYNLEFVDEANEDDLIFEEHGARIYIDPKSLVYLDGTQVDYTKEGLQEGSNLKIRMSKTLAAAVRASTFKI